MDKALEIADEALTEFRDAAFWNWRPDVKASMKNIRDIIKELRLNGGHRGYQKAAEILHALNSHATTSTPEADPEAPAGLDQ